MSVEQFVAYLTWAVFLLLFGLVAVEAVRRPLPGNIDTLLLFAAPAANIVILAAAQSGLVQRGPYTVALGAALQLAIPLLTVRLLSGFAQVPAWLLRSATAAYGLLAAGGFLFAPQPLWFTALQVAYFVILELYSGVAFAREARRAYGVTRRRLAIVACGNLLLGLGVASAALRFLGPGWLAIFQLCIFGAALAYFIGFAPPGSVRRSWQEPELRAFLKGVSGLLREPDLASLIGALERGAAATLGAPLARLGLLDKAGGVLRFQGGAGPFQLPLAADSAAARAFVEQRPIFRAHDPPGPTGPIWPGQADLAVMAAPISVGDERYGVLTVYAPRQAFFGADDLEVVALIAAQSAVVFQSRALVGDLAQAQARAEAARLKDDFLSAAAHDLKTPMTTLVGQAQLLQRRLGKSSYTPLDRRSIELIAQEAERLRALIDDLLDAARSDGGRLVRARERLRLAELVGEVSARYKSERHPLRVDADAEALCEGDRLRLGQLVGHLVDNAIKFSPDGGEIALGIKREAGQVILSIADRGIGIPGEDLPRIFERFFRASNVDDRSFAGMGLSLSICRAIVEQHGGRIWVESQLGAGSVFYVSLPLATEEQSDEPVRASHPDH